MTRTARVFPFLALAVLWLGCTRAPSPAPTARTPVLVARGLPGAEAVAVNPQGSPMVATASSAGAIVRILGRAASLTLTETTGRPRGLAFDASGDLYVADADIRALLRITPWGQLQLVSENLAAPEGVGVDGGGNVYLSDTAASKIYRLSPNGGFTLFTDAIRNPGALAASLQSGDLFVADQTRTIWRLAQHGGRPEQFAQLKDTGRLAAMALDERGNLYVARDGGGQVSVLDPAGRVIDAYPIPGPRVTGVSFGGYGLDVLFISESSTGALYKLRAPHRSQRLPWEPGQPLRITYPPDGAILNRHDGQITSEGLRITVQGSCAPGSKVLVNQHPATVDGGRFQAQFTLSQRENRISAEAAGSPADSATVLWDRGSFPRYRFSTDDNIWFLRDIARNAGRYQSIFENPYLAFWREMNRKYGTKVHHNIYYETSGFNLSQMPAKYRAEWQANASWMRLSFHARSNNPARPYLHASPETLRHDYRLVNREIERFAGPNLLSPVTTLHWGAATGEACRALREEGVRVLLGADHFRDDLPYVGYYLSVPQLHRILGRDYYKDITTDILFLHHDIVVNNVPLDKIDAFLDRIASDPHESEVMELIIHEQYYHPDYRAYEPDYTARCERAIQWVTRRGYKPVLFSEGFLGAP